ncbi:MAG TPA: AAA family ATPase, partial [Candidatus Tectomicrobia bacterium]
MAAILAAFDRVSEGASEILLVSGYAGIGKSALVQELYKPITQQRGFFIRGKFDQLHRDMPYAPLLQALRALIQQLLAAGEAQIAAWRDTLLHALGPHGQVLIEVIPEVELILGPQPAVTLLEQGAAQNRFHRVLRNFIGAFSHSEHPLVLFLDDLQWSDSASLHLLQLLMTAPETHHLLLIGAYRDNEVHGAHPLLLALEAIRHAGTVVNTLALQPLDLADGNQLIADALASAPEKTPPLTALVLAKTGGNPFFTNAFLTALWAEHLLIFDSQQLAWHWDVGRVQACGLTDNVIELMTSKVLKLHNNTRRVLVLAACIGNQFDLHTLAIVHDKTLRDTAADLWEAMREGLVLPLDEAYKLMELDVQGLPEMLRVEYRFAHDRIQQAVYDLIPPQDRQALHLQVGQVLLRTTPPDEREQYVFPIVNHLNLGMDAMPRHADRTTLVELNSLAAGKAKSAAAYQAALTYAQTGIGLLGTDCWERQYERALALHMEAAAVAYLAGDYFQMRQILDVVLQHAKTVLDTVQAYGIELLAYSAQYRFKEGVRVGLHMLAMLGLTLPDQPESAEVLQELEEIRQALAGKDIEALSLLPKMTDPLALAAMDTLMKLTLPAYNTSPDLSILINLTMVGLSVKYGNTSFSIKAYVSYGLILCNIVGDIERGYAFGCFALRMLEQTNAREVETAVIYIYNFFIRPWKEPVSASLDAFSTGYQKGLETGSLEFACLNLRAITVQSYWCGRELEEVEREARRCCETVRQLKQGHALHYAQVYWQATLNLMGRSEHPCRLIGEAYDEEAMLPLLKAAENFGVLCNVYGIKAILSYIFQDCMASVEYIRFAQKYLRAVTGTMAWAALHFYDALIHLAIFHDVGSAQQTEILVAVTQHQTTMARWAHHAPMNFQHKWLLIEAERARVLGNIHDAREYYDQAIVAAQHHAYLQDEALAHELAGKFYLARGADHIARYYLHDAHYSYQRWGAVAKVKDLETRYPQFLLPYATTPRQGVVA